MNKARSSEYCGGCGSKLIPVKKREAFYDSKSGQRQYKTYWPCPKSGTAVGFVGRCKYILLHPLDMFTPHEDPRSTASFGY